MSMYAMVFGDDKLPSRSGFLLGLLGNPDVGRFRDAWLEKDSEGTPQVAVYTRNGGGNRNCWHEDDPNWGGPTCKHEAFRRERTVWLDKGEGDPKPEWRVGRQWPRRTEYLTGEFEDEDSYKCLAPNSPECGCTGCITQYLLPAHPLYISDQDDDFDCTYATFYFRVPPEHVEELTPLAGDHVDTSERWADVIASISNIGKESS